MGINLEAGKSNTLSGRGMLSFTMAYDTAVWAKLADKTLYSWVPALQIFEVVAPFKRAVCELVGAFCDPCNCGYQRSRVLLMAVVTAMTKVVMVLASIPTEGLGGNTISV